MNQERMQLLCLTDIENLPNMIIQLIELGKITISIDITDDITFEYIQNIINIEGYNGLYSIITDVYIENYELNKVA